MTTEKDFMGVQHWTSERFEKDVENLSPLDHFYEDEDPRIVLVTDRWGDECWVVGYTDPIELPCPRPSLKKIGPYVLVVRVRDNALMGVHPSAVDL